MPKESRCSICTDPRARVAVAERRGKGDSFQQIASHLSLTKSSVARHAKHANLPGRDAAPSSDRKSSQAKRRRIGARCQQCGTLLEDPTPQALVRRAERVLAFGEQIMAKAIEDQDFRLGLQAIDRARGSLEQLLKVHGLLQPDGGNTTIDNRKQVIQVLANLDEGELRALVAGGAPTRGNDELSVVTSSVDPLRLPTPE